MEKKRDCHIKCEEGKQARLYFTRVVSAQGERGITVEGSDWKVTQGFSWQRERVLQQKVEGHGPGQEVALKDEGGRDRGGRRLQRRKRLARGRGLREGGTLSHNLPEGERP